MNYDIELGQGDGDSIGIILKEDGTACNLTGAFVKFHIKSIDGTEYEIECTDGAIINGVEVPKVEGGVTIQFTSLHAKTPGVFYGKFIVTLLNSQASFPSGNKYITVRVWEAV